MFLSIDFPLPSVVKTQGSIFNNNIMEEINEIQITQELLSDDIDNIKMLDEFEEDSQIDERFAQQIGF